MTPKSWTKNFYCCPIKLQYVQKRMNWLLIISGCVPFLYDKPHLQRFHRLSDKTVIKICIDGDYLIR